MAPPTFSPAPIALPIPIAIVFKFYIIFRKLLSYFCADILIIKTMGFKKGHAKVGGRKKGEPNRATALTKATIAEMLQEYKSSGLMDSDFLKLEPKDRLMVAEKLMQYTMPKIQSVEVDVSENLRKKTIEDRLIELAEEL
jgi:hypothetical protein